MKLSFLPELPVGWASPPLKHACILNPEVLPESTPDDTEIEYVDIAAIEGGTSDLSPKLMPFGSAPSRARRVLRAGDTILSTVRTYLKAVATFPEVESKLIASTGFAVLRPVGRLHPRFAYWAVLSEAFIESVVAHSEGVSYPAINPSVLGDLNIVQPPYSAQEQIANFLDDKTAQIDALIAEKERLLESVAEYTQAKLSQIMVQGITGASLVATGNSFVPLVPSHWKVTSFKRALRGMNQGWSPQCDNRPAEANEWGVLKVGCVNGHTFNAMENKALPQELSPDLACVIRAGDVLVSRANTRELVGMAALVDADYPNLLLCDKLYRLELKADWILPEYAVLLLRAEGSRRQIELGASGASSSMQNISQDVLRELVVSFPPVEEQREIVKSANEVKLACAELKSHVEQHLSRLREYRSSLISAAVTGQQDINAPSLEVA